MKTAIVLGGAGFLGRHICKSLLSQVYRVHAVDNYSTWNSRLRLEVSEIPHIYGNWDYPADPSQLSDHDLDCTEVDLLIRKIDDIFKRDGVDEIWHFASAASPQEYRDNPIGTIRLATRTLDAVLQYAADLPVAQRPTVVFASTSEVYGDPDPGVFGPHGIGEEYNGNVSTTGPRSMYDEAKRAGEAICAVYAERTKVIIPRIHNTYGPGMSPYDPRVMSTILRCAITNDQFTMYDNGEQFRTFCYVSDTVEQLMVARKKSISGLPVNVGGVDHIQIRSLVDIASQMSGANMRVFAMKPRMDENDPRDRRPDLRRIRQLGYAYPKVGLWDGMRRTMSWMERYLAVTPGQR